MESINPDFIIPMIKKNIIEGNVSQEMITSKVLNFPDGTYHHLLPYHKDNESHGLFWYKLDATQTVPAGSWFYNTIRNEVEQAKNDYSMLEHCIRITDSDNPDCGFALDEETSVVIHPQSKTAHFIKSR